MAVNLKNKIVILRPRVTEKASSLQAENVYSFEVEKNATKKEIARNISEIYKVKPIRVNISRNPGKRVIFKGKRGQTNGIKKAYVYLKVGDKIEI